jgi:hypothetical protein
MAPKTLRIYGGLNIGMACLYLFFFIYVVPPYSPALRWGFGLLSLAMIFTGLGQVFAQRWSRLIGIVLGFVLLGLCFTITAMLVAAAAYLKGVYGAFGQGATYATFVGIAMVVPYFGLPGAFQVYGMFRRDVREHFAR